MWHWLAANWWWLALAGAVLLIGWSCLHVGSDTDDRDEHEQGRL